MQYGDGAVNKSRPGIMADTLPLNKVYTAVVSITIDCFFLEITTLCSMDTPCTGVS